MYVECMCTYPSGLVRSPDINSDFFTAVDCGDLIDPANGRIIKQPTPESTTLGSFATYFCNEGFRLMGDSIRACLQNGRWSGNDPTCVGEVSAII